MKRRLLIGLTISCISIAGVPAIQATAHDAPLRCGSKKGAGAGWFKLRSHHGIGCPKARALAQRWEDKCVWRNNCPGDPDRIKKIKPGFKCRNEQAGYETVRVRCAADKGPGVVHFLWGS